MCLKVLKQEAQLSRRDRATRCVIEILSPAAQLYEQLHLQDHSRSPKKWLLMNVKSSSETIVEIAGQWPRMLSDLFVNIS